MRETLAVLNEATQKELTFFVLHYHELNPEAVAALANYKFDCLCVDELHYIKKRSTRESSLRRKAMDILRDCASTAIGLTGTPLINELSEPISLLQTLSGYDPRFDYERLDNSRLGDLADVFETLLPHIIRRRKDEVLLGLSSCEIETIEIPLPETLYRQMLEIYTWPRQRAGEALTELRKISVEAKLPYLLQQAQLKRKLLILSYYKTTVSRAIYSCLAETLPGQVAYIDGETSPPERQRLLNSFRSSEGVRVLVGTFGTVGESLTLFDQALDETASDIIVADLPYTWAGFEQGIARLHRDSQKQQVHVDVLISTHTASKHDVPSFPTLDRYIWEFIQGKRELSEVAIDGRYDMSDAETRLEKALYRWLSQAREIGVEENET